MAWGWQRPTLIVVDYAAQRHAELTHWLDELTDQPSPAAHPLRIGLSMEVTLDTQDQAGKRLSDVPRATPVAQTQVFEALDRAAESEVQRIIAANLGKPMPVSGPGVIDPTAARPARPALRS